MWSRLEAREKTDTRTSSSAWFDVQLVLRTTISLPCRFKTTSCARICCPTRLKRDRRLASYLLQVAQVKADALVAGHFRVCSCLRFNFHCPVMVQMCTIVAIGALVMMMMAGGGTGAPYFCQYLGGHWSLRNRLYAKGRCAYSIAVCVHRTRGQYSSEFSRVCMYLMYRIRLFGAIGGTTESSLLLLQCVGSW